MCTNIMEQNMPFPAYFTNPRLLHQGTLFIHADCFISLATEAMASQESK